MDIKQTIIQSRASSVSKIKKMIDGVDVVTFDIFDTLILRDVPKPVDLFTVVESRSGLPFTDVRHQAEVSLRAAHPEWEEVTLDQIYSYMTMISEADKERLKAEEICAELEYCNANPEMKDLYEYCIENGKKVYAISDMYLPKNVIEEILKNAGYEMTAVYVSGEFVSLEYVHSDGRKTYGASKDSGKLFDLFLEKEGLNPEKVLHIGDAFKADYLRPKKRKMKSALYGRKQYDRRLFDNTCAEALTEKAEDSQIADRIMLSLVKNAGGSKKNLWDILGYCAAGPMLLGFTQWLHGKLSESQADQYFFLSREGKIFMDAFIQMYPQEKEKCRYLEVSRRALVFPSLSNVKDGAELSKKVSLSPYENGAAFMEYFHLGKEDIPAGMAVPDTIRQIYEDENLLEKLLPVIRAKAKEQRNILQEYFEQKHLKESCAIIDIGWQGKMQYALQEVLGDAAEIQGYYFGIMAPGENSYLSELKRQACFFDEAIGIHPDYVLGTRYTISLLESMFLPAVGTVLGYEKNVSANRVEPILAAYEGDETQKENFRRLQKQMMQFVADYQSRTEGCRQSDINVTPDHAFSFYQLAVAENTTEEMVELCREISFKDTEEGRLTAEHGRFYYLTHIRQLKNDLQKNHARVIFLKSIFRWKLNYMNICSWISRHK